MVFRGQERIPCGQAIVQDGRGRTSEYNDEVNPRFREELTRMPVDQKATTKDLILNGIKELRITSV